MVLTSIVNNKLFLKKKKKNSDLTLSSFLFPNLSLPQLSFSLSKSFSKIFSIFLLKINNTAILFLFFFLQKKINEKGDYFATFCLVAKKIKEKCLENQRKIHRKSLISSMQCLEAEKTKRKRKSSLKNKPFSPPQRNPRKPNPITPSMLLNPPQNCHQPPSKHQNC